MSNVDEGLADLVRGAVALELNGEYFYKRAAEATQHPRGKAMFLRLAEQEQGHIEEIGALFSGMVDADEWERLSSEETASPRTSPVITELEAAIAARGRPELADDTQALRLGMELERRAIQFFEGLKVRTNDPMKLRMIKHLIEEEHFHYDFLQTQLDSVLNVGIWLDAPEFRQDGKF